MNATVTPARLVAQNVPLSRIKPSATNPRQHFDKRDLAELTESIKLRGVLQPVLVRPQTGEHVTIDTATHEPMLLLVAGERRYRAALAAGLQEIPAVVRDMDDTEALEAQVVENLQRADLHEIEEAEAYEQLQKLHNCSVKDLAAKVSKSKEYVYARLKLTALTQDVRQLFYDGRVNASVALLLARIPVPKLQNEAARLVAGDDKRESMSTRQAADHLQRAYMLRLNEAPFAIKDATLLPSAGSCVACPKRTGNDASMYADVKSPDVCTDPVCFAAKRDAHVVLLRKAAEAKGQAVVTGKNAEKMVQYGRPVAGFIDLDAKNYSDPKQRTARQILGKDCPTPTLVESEPGKFVSVIAVATPELKSKLGVATGGRSDAEKRRDAAARLENGVRAAVFAAIAEKHTGTAMTPADGALIAAKLFARSDHETCKRVLEIWEPAAIAKTKAGVIWDVRESFGKRIPKLTPPELVRLMVQLAIADEAHVAAHESAKATGGALFATAERLDIDHTAIRRDVTNGAKAKAKAKPAKVAKAKAAKLQPAKPAKANGKTKTAGKARKAAAAKAPKKRGAQLDLPAVPDAIAAATQAPAADGAAEAAA